MTTRANDIASLLSHNNGGIDSSSLPSYIVYKNNGSIDSSSLPSNIVYGLSGLPSGTKALFVQSAAPTGWTKDTSHDNKALRVVSGTVSSGGSDGFTTTFGTGKSTAGHTLTTDQMPSHSHNTRPRIYTAGPFRVHNHDFSGDNAGQWVETSHTGGNQAHSHNLNNFNLAYVDVIIATKN